MAMLIHLNGAPGVGKSTVAARYAAAHPGVLNCDIDRLRTMIGGWEDDFEATGDVVRPVALAMITAHLAGGRDVVLPQMLARESERSRFEAAAAGHDYLQVLLQAAPGMARERFAARTTDDPLHAVVGRSVEQQGGDVVIDVLERRLEEAAASNGAVVIGADGDVEGTCRAVTQAVSSTKRQGLMGETSSLDLSSTTADSSPVKE